MLLLETFSFLFQKVSETGVATANSSHEMAVCLNVTTRPIMATR